MVGIRDIHQPGLLLWSYPSSFPIGVDKDMHLHILLSVVQVFEPGEHALRYIQHFIGGDTPHCIHSISSTSGKNVIASQLGVGWTVSPPLVSNSPYSCSWATIVEILGYW